MKRKTSLSILIICTGFIFTNCQQPSNRLTAQEVEEGWTLLFDGESLKGWRDYNGEGVTAPWKAEKGTLTALGEGSDSTGYIVSQKQYENFIVTFDWKIEEGGNSGFLYHVVERPGFKVPYVTGPEYQVIDDIGFPDPLEEWQKAGADYAMYVCDNDKKMVKRAGAWNTSRIVFDNGKV
ncbi:MAG: DUF1080 domain-containing protein, partial [Bacteroidales bacterium]|nr:DUF1080 domain-containing protein [Bacteroidales bacterium]